MDRLNAKDPTLLFDEGIDLSLPNEMIQEMSHHLPFQARVALAQASTSLSNALPLPGEIADLFLVLNNTNDEDEIVALIDTIPVVTPDGYAAIMRAFVGRVMDKSKQTSGLILAACSDAVHQAEARFAVEGGEMSENRQWAAKRDFLIARLLIGIQAYTKNRGGPFPMLDEEMRSLPKWCWPDVIIASDKAMRHYEAVNGFLYYRPQGWANAPYRNDAAILILLEDLDEIGSTLSIPFLGEMAAVWLERSGETNVCQRMMSKLSIPEDRKNALEWSVADALSRRVPYRKVSLSEVLPKWDQGSNTMFEKLHERLILGAGTYSDTWIDTKVFNQVSKLSASHTGDLFTWVMGGSREQFAALLGVESTAVSFWDSYWCEIKTVEEFHQNMRTISEMPWQLQPTLMRQLVTLSSPNSRIGSDDFELSERVPLLVERCIDEGLFDLAIRALNTPLTVAMYWDNSAEAKASNMAHALTLAQTRLPVSSWGELVDTVVESTLHRPLGYWLGEEEDDPRAAFLLAFFSSAEALWTTPFKPRCAESVVAALWDALPDRSGGGVNKVDVFCTQFTFDKEREVELRKALD